MSKKTQRNLKKRRKRHERNRVFEDCIIAADIKLAAGGKVEKFLDFKENEMREIDITRRRFLN